MDDNLTQSILELERQIQGLTYSARQHDLEIARLHEQVKRAVLALQKEGHDLPAKERDLRQLELHMTQLQGEIARKKALMEKEERDVRSLQSRELKAQKDTDALKKTAANLKQQLDGKKRAAWRLSQLKKHD